MKSNEKAKQCEHNERAQFDFMFALNFIGIESHLIANLHAENKRIKFRRCSDSLVRFESVLDRRIDGKCSPIPLRRRDENGTRE